MTDQRETLESRYPNAQKFTFGDSQVMSDKLLALVRSGSKTATCDALRNYPEGSSDMPVVGRRDIALEWDGRPALVIDFAAETENLLKNARDKRKRKSCDWLLANDVSGGKVFGAEENHVTLIAQDQMEEWTGSKTHIAAELVHAIEKHFKPS